ncbi:protein kinase domain-containing protein [Paracraurococcus lichenis]|uniref:non-specific serine/threonine protein kinase n=1 Tax=Paracraurococcus lichenis TaxID=3064888 RepID=A0ABT9E534_9PROT|nr:protein kinase [Paracraurococcus sp. LOR1-02]MDO9711279.1 protein kinase [Paracraurococcus sp. LOR1-02]
MNEKNLWKPKHPGVPREWEQLGEGGNAVVWSDGQAAIKRLKPGANAEAVGRFKREAEILASLAGGVDLRVVAVKQVREREDGLEIVMERLDGNLDQVIERFAGQPEKAARALIPVAETLASLAVRERAIYHREIKPTNLLYRKNEDTLYVADFGCAYLAEDVRLTPANRAMGALAYRPPEYSTGRIDTVTEKGDVFSLSKLYWSMINGIRGSFFPESMGYLKEYDLSLKFDRHPKMQHAMLIVSKAASVMADARPNLAQFADMLRAIIAYPPDESARAAVEMLQAQARIEVEHQQRQASTATFVRATHADLKSAISNLSTANPELLMWREWMHEITRTSQVTEELVRQVADQGSDAPALVVRFRRCMFHARYYPTDGKNPVNLTLFLHSEDDAAAASSLSVYNEPHGLRFEKNLRGEVLEAGQYTPGVQDIFLIEATKVVMKMNPRRD